MLFVNSSQECRFDVRKHIYLAKEAFQERVIVHQISGALFVIVYYVTFYIETVTTNMTYSASKSAFFLRAN